MENLYILGPITLGKSLKSRVRIKETEKKLTPPSHVRMTMPFPMMRIRLLYEAISCKKLIPIFVVRWASDVPTQMFPAGRLVIQRGRIHSLL